MGNLTRASEGGVDSFRITQISIVTSYVWPISLVSITSSCCIEHCLSHLNLFRPVYMFVSSTCVKSSTRFCHRLNLRKSNGASLWLKYIFISRIFFQNSTFYLVNYENLIIFSLFQVYLKNNNKKTEGIRIYFSLSRLYSLYFNYFLEMSRFRVT